jgi:hypothetical protein
MYAILSRTDLSDVVSWLDHGRSWKVHKPREFEVKVIPTYFEHNKFSSFIRQANGWGFRRIISKGDDRNSYYHELFMRGVPHLVKVMKRPPPSSKPLADARSEPHFKAISQEHPLPELKKAGDHNFNNDEEAHNDMILAHCTLVEQHQVFHAGRLITTTTGDLKLPANTITTTSDHANPFPRTAYSSSGAMQGHHGTPFDLEPYRLFNHHSKNASVPTGYLNQQLSNNGYQQVVAEEYPPTYQAAAKALSPPEEVDRSSGYQAVVAQTTLPPPSSQEYPKTQQSSNNCYQVIAHQILPPRPEDCPPPQSNVYQVALPPSKECPSTISPEPYSPPSTSFDPSAPIPYSPPCFDATAEAAVMDPLNKHDDEDLKDPFARDGMEPSLVSFWLLD